MNNKSFETNINGLISTIQNMERDELKSCLTRYGNKVFATVVTGLSQMEMVSLCPVAVIRVDDEPCTCYVTAARLMYNGEICISAIRCDDHDKNNDGSTFHVYPENFYCGELTKIISEL